MMGVPLTGMSYIYGDNMPVIQNTQRPESTLNKKNNSILYHTMLESVAMVESLIYRTPTNFNIANMLTKMLFVQNNRGVVEGVLYDVFDWFYYPCCCNLYPKKSLERSLGNCGNIRMYDFM